MSAKPPKTPAVSFRLTPDDLAILDAIRKALAPPHGKPLDRTETIRIVLRYMNENFDFRQKSGKKR